MLVLHGGSADSTLPVARLHPAVMRMAAVARSLARAHPDMAVYRLRNSVRGWNGDGAAVLSDARWAVEGVAQAHPGAPLVIVGHSLGGRVAAHLAREGGRAQEEGPTGDYGQTTIEDERAREDERAEVGRTVAGAVLLAPWLEPDDPVAGLVGVSLSVVQGTRDRTIPTSSTESWLVRASAAGALVRRAFVEHGEHTMLRRRRRWDRLCVDGIAWVLESATCHPIRQGNEPER